MVYVWYHEARLTKYALDGWYAPRPQALSWLVILFLVVSGSHHPQVIQPFGGRSARKGIEMTNEDMMIILERYLLIPVRESDAALILAVVEERLRNENSAQQSVQADECPSCAGSGRKEVGGMLLTCLACDGTGIRR